ncbi:hypothetical protein EV421DRAFT_1742483 [Armillaria borealis]|uniref:Uncharacterized protein n=1 Tax=Armillaria borealis TaxID=47425 RepID=A0AA39MG32_9AGAR|nr:hypothetical protein EV421DRAFT_1742483 [Armillaria borealis]
MATHGTRTVMTPGDMLQMRRFGNPLSSLTREGSMVFWWKKSKGDSKIGKEIVIAKGDNGVNDYKIGVNATEVSEDLRFWFAWGTINSVWSPVWYHAGMERGHTATQVIG